MNLRKLNIHYKVLLFAGTKKGTLLAWAIIGLPQFHYLSHFRGHRVTEEFCPS